MNFFQLLTYSSQNPSYFAEPSVPPRHAIILRGGFSIRCGLFGAHCVFLATFAKATESQYLTNVSPRPLDNI